MDCLSSYKYGCKGSKGFEKFPYSTIFPLSLIRRIVSARLFTGSQLQIFAMLVEPFLVIGDVADQSDEGKVGDTLVGTWSQREFYSSIIYNLCFLLLIADAASSYCLITTEPQNCESLTWELRSLATTG